MSCRHDMANGTCKRCYPSTGTLDPGPEEDYEPNMEGPGAVTAEECAKGGMLPPEAVSYEPDPRETVVSPTFRKLKIVVPEGVPELATITLDGKRLDHVARVDIAVAPHERSWVRLTMLADVEVEGDVNVLESEHAQSRHNKAAVMESQLAGCFYCLGLVMPSWITEWVDEEGTTAVCPECGIDSLIPRMELKSPMLLLQLRKRYFDE